MYFLNLVVCKNNTIVSASFVTKGHAWEGMVKLVGAKEKGTILVFLLIL